MNIKKIATLLLAGTLAIVFALAAVAQAATEERERLATSDSSVSSEASQLQMEGASSADEEDVNEEHERTAKPSTQAPEGRASEECAQQ
jgi:hypothetical protein